ncbi:MAG: hypothetical protein HXX11_06735 [Desulfuromonadales bacterium]|nr:hypothetical protein [Desulfuromonadales bacterium]
MKLHCVIQFFICILIVGISNADNVLQTNNYMVTIPENWTVETRDNSTTILDPEFKNGEVSISISTKPTNNKMSLNEVWAKIEPLMVTGKIKISESEDVISDNTWKKLEIEEIVCNKKIITTVLFTIKYSLKYFINFVCPKDNYHDVIPHFNSVKKTFKFIHK